MKTANSAAYQQLTPTGDGIVDDIKYWNEDAKQRRREEEERKDKLFKREQAEKKRKREFYEANWKPLNADATGSKSLDYKLGSFLQGVVNEKYPELLETLADADPGSSDYLNAKLQLTNLQNLPKKINQVTKGLSSQFQEYKDLKEKGAVWEDTKGERYFQDGFQSLELMLDPEGNLNIATFDRDNDGKNDFEDVHPFHELIDGTRSLFSIRPKHNILALATEDANALGESDVTKLLEDGFTTEQVKEKTLDSMQRRAKHRLGFEDGDKDTSTVYKSWLIENQLEDTPENRQAAEDQYVQIMKDNSDYFSKMDKDNSGRAALINARRPRAGSGKSTKNQPSFNESVKPSETTWGAQFSNIDPKAQNVGVSNVKIAALKDGDETISNAVVKNYTYSKDGKLLLDVTVPKFKTVTKTEALKVKNDENADAESKNAMEKVLAQMANSGKDKIRTVIPDQNEERQIEVPKEDEAKVAQEMGVSISDLKAKAFPNGESTNIPQNKYGI